LTPYTLQGYADGSDDGGIDFDDLVVDDRLLFQELGLTQEEVGGH
jgi:hypothetical protein